MFETDENWIIAEPEIKNWNKTNFPLQEETGKIIGTCMEIHRLLGKGFAEIVCKDALEFECKQKHFPYEREKRYDVTYKGIILPHYFFADFVLFEKIIVEIKSQIGIAEEHHSQLINYLAVSQCPVGLLINFGESSLRFKRYTLTKNHIQ
jgi:GxxExxY protein